MAYRLMQQLVAQGRRTKEQLLEMADVYYAVGRMTSTEYADIIAQIQDKKDILPEK